MSLLDSMLVFDREPLSPLPFEPAKRSTNPKDDIGSTKLPVELWPAEATAVGCLGMLEGAVKYGRNNFVAGDGVIASIYVAACKRHLDAWFSGEDLSTDLIEVEPGVFEPINIPHLGNALSCLAIIVKAQAHGKLVDDRNYDPEGSYRKLVDKLTPHVSRIKKLFASKKPKHYTIADNKPAE